MIIHLFNTYLTVLYCLFLTAQYHSFWLQHRKVVWNLHLYGDFGGPTTIICTAWLSSRNPTGFLIQPSWRTSSRPRESHPQSLNEPYVILSHHTALIILSHYRLSLTNRVLPDQCLLTPFIKRIIMSLRSTSITEASTLLQTFPPPCLHWYSFSCGSSTWNSLLTASRGFPRSVQTPMLKSCHLCAAHRLVSKQVSSKLIPD